MVCWFIPHGVGPREPTETRLCAFCYRVHQQTQVYGSQSVVPNSPHSYRLVRRAGLDRHTRAGGNDREALGSRRVDVSDLRIALPADTSPGGAFCCANDGWGWRVMDYRRQVAGVRMACSHEITRLPGGGVIRSLCHRGCTHMT